MCDPVNNTSHWARAEEMKSIVSRELIKNRSR